MTPRAEVWGRLAGFGAGCRGRGLPQPFPLHVPGAWTSRTSPAMPPGGAPLAACGPLAVDGYGWKGWPEMGRREERGRRYHTRYHTTG